MTIPATPILPDYLAPGLDVVFAGAAPSLSSEQVGHYYAGPTNNFGVCCTRPDLRRACSALRRTLRFCATASA